MQALRRALLLLTAALLMTGIGFAQSGSAEFNANGNGGVQTADHEFMGRAAQEGIARFQLAYLALQNAKSEEVKAFARQVLADYYKSQPALIDIATQQFVELPTEKDPKQQAVFDSLSQLHGEAFDKAYIEAMLKGQRSGLSQLKQEAKKGNNQSVINWANQTLPVLQDQFKEAEKLAPSVGITGDKGSTKSDTAAQESH
jgi:putative membrane protein